MSNVRTLNTIGTLEHLVEAGLDDLLSDLRVRRDEAPRESDLRDAIGEAMDQIENAKTSLEQAVAELDHAEDLSNGDER